MEKRKTLKGLLAAAYTLTGAGLHARPVEPGITAREILLGQSLSRSGALGQTDDVVNGALACFDRVNRAGGVHGRRIRAITLDDGYQVASTVANTRQLIEQDGVFALFNYLGTANVAAVLPLLARSGVPIFTPFTGASALRDPPIPFLFNVRPSYAQEGEKLVQHLDTLGIRRIAALYFNNAFGKDGLAGVEKATQERGRKLVGAVPIEFDMANLAAATQAMAELAPDAVVMITTGFATIEFIKSLNRIRRGILFYTLSVMGNQGTIQLLGPDGAGVVVAAVVPHPWSLSVPVSREYRAAMQTAGFDGLSYPGFEAYINARVLVEALQRAGPDPTRPKLIAAAESMQQVDLGGFEVSFGKSNRQGSTRVELTMIGASGRFVK